MPFEIPESWEWIKLGNVAHVINGKSQSSVVNPQGKYPIYGSGGIMGYADDYLCPEHCTIVGRKGTINNPTLVETKFWNVDTAFGISPDKNIDYLYFHYFCKSFDFTSLDASTTLPSLTKGNIELIDIPLPPREEQTRIVSAIQKLFSNVEIIESNKSDLQGLIKQAKKVILNLAIHGKLVSQDPTDEPASELLKRIAPNATLCDTSHYENIPKSWCVIRLGEIYNHTTGKALKKSNSEGVLREYLTTSNVYWNAFDFSEVRSMYFMTAELDKCTVHKGDLLICNGGDVGRAAIWTYDYDICIQNHISKLRPKYNGIINNVFCSYIFMHLKSKGLLNGKGVAITSLSATDIQSIAIPLPPINEQNRIVQAIQTIEDSLQAITSEL